MKLRALFQSRKPDVIVILALGAVIAAVLVFFIFAVLFKYFD
jgi:hypothetical protein